MNYIGNNTTFPSWIKQLHIFLDNTKNMNKNAYFMGWGMEAIIAKMSRLFTLFISCGWSHEV